MLCLSLLGDLPEFVLDSTAADFLKQGQAVRVDNTSLSGLLSLVLENGEFIGIGEASQDGKILPKRLMNTAR